MAWILENHQEIKHEHYLLPWKIPQILKKKTRKTIFTVLILSCRQNKMMMEIQSTVYRCLKDLGLHVKADTETILVWHIR